MIYEERIYTIMAGKLADVESWFAEFAVPLFEKHKIKLVGFWQPIIGRQNFEFVYLLEFEDLNDRMQKWNSFFADPEWLPTLSRIQTAAGETFVTQIENKILMPVGFSPLK